MNQLFEFASAKDGQGIIPIKLRDILSLLPKNQLKKDILIQYPPVEIGSITLVDQILLLSLIDLLNPNNILEIGTFQGYTTALFLKNTTHSIVHTIDLPKTDNNFIEEPDKESVLLDGDYNDDYLRQIQNLSGETYLCDLEQKNLDRLKLIKSNSTEFDYSRFNKSIDLAFIDGGHNFDIIKSDTKNVLSCLNKNSVVVWHDYSSDIHSDVTKFLDTYSKENKIFCVNGSLCAFQIFI